MKRDMDLVREILLALEKHPTTVSNPEELRLEAADKDELWHNFNILEDAGFITFTIIRSWRGGGFVREEYETKGPYRLTWQGHEFIDTIRDPELWSKTKAGADAVKSWSTETLKEIGKGLIKRQIEEYTGVKF
jgi:hypothetical protein